MQLVKVSELVSLFHMLAVDCFITWNRVEKGAITFSESMRNLLLIGVLFLLGLEKKKR